MGCSRDELGGDEEQKSSERSEDLALEVEVGGPQRRRPNAPPEPPAWLDGPDGGEDAPEPTKQPSSTLWTGRSPEDGRHRRKRETRPQTLSVRQLQRDKRRLPTLSYPEGITRPKVRADCAAVSSCPHCGEAVTMVMAQLPAPRGKALGDARRPDRRGTRVECPSCLQRVVLLSDGHGEWTWEPWTHAVEESAAEVSEAVSRCRPCVFVGCRWNLFLDVQANSSIRLNFPDLEPDEIPQSCALDVADAGGATLEKVAEFVNLTRERVRQLEERLLPSMRDASPEMLEHLELGQTSKRSRSRVVDRFELDALVSEQRAEALAEADD